MKREAREGGGEGGEEKKKQKAVWRLMSYVAILCTVRLASAALGLRVRRLVARQRAGNVPYDKLPPPGKNTVVISI